MIVDDNESIRNSSEHTVTLSGRANLDTDAARIIHGAMQHGAAGVGAAGRGAAGRGAAGLGAAERGAAEFAQGCFTGARPGSLEETQIRTAVAVTAEPFAPGVGAAAAPPVAKAESATAMTDQKQMQNKQTEQTEQTEQMQLAHPRTAAEFRAAAQLATASGNTLAAQAHQHAAKLAEKEVKAKERAAERADKVALKKAQRDAERAATAAEKERVKNLATSRAAKWAAGLARDIGVCSGLIQSVPGEANVLESIRTEYVKRFAEWLSKLQDLQQSMHSCQDEDVAASLLTSGPLQVGEFHSCVRNWKKQLAINKP